MMELFGVIANDNLNKYNERLTIGAIVNMYLSQWRDIFPMTVNHDNTRLIGYSRFFGIFIEPGATHLINQSIIPENDKEKHQLEKTFGKVIARNLYEKNKEDYDKLLTLLDGHLSVNRKLLYPNSIAIEDEGIVPKLFPELWAKQDKDGLILLSELTPVMPGIFLYKNHLIYAHHYFRRSLSRRNNLNAHFLKRLQELTPNAKIALDPNLIGLVGSQSEGREYAYWWGPKFNDDLGSIPIGVTKYKNENYDTLMSPILHTECGWYIQDNIRTFECEEITDVINIYDSNDSYGCRYVHSMLSSSNIPQHLDGAIRAYDDEKMIKRLECNMDKAERNTTYTKLWRVDGKIEINVWKELITHFYRDNILIGEYFSGQKYSEHTDKISERSNSESQTKKINDFIPIQIAEGAGLRIQIKIDEPEEINSDYDVLMRPLYYSINKASFKAIEYESISLKKVLNRTGLKVRTPYCGFLEFNDLAVNFPLLVCSSADSANTIFSAILEFCKIWSEQHDDRIVSFAVKINYTTCAITYSMIGHINDFLHMFSNTADCIFVESTNDLGSWCEKFRNKMNIFPTANQTPSISELNKTNGILHYRRAFIEDKFISKVYTDDRGMYIDLNLEKNTIKKLADNHITTSTVFKINSSICCKCGHQYESCECIKFIDEDCYNSLNDYDNLGYFWTTRQAYDMHEKT